MLKYYQIFKAYFFILIGIMGKREYQILFHSNIAKYLPVNDNTFIFSSYDVDKISVKKSVLQTDFPIGYRNLNYFEKLKILIVLV